MSPPPKEKIYLPMVHFRAFLHVSSAQKHMLSALYAIARLFRSVRPSVRLSHEWINPKRLKL